VDRCVEQEITFDKKRTSGSFETLYSTNINQRFKLFKKARSDYDRNEPPELPHPLRVLTYHISYLEAYRHYLIYKRGGVRNVEEFNRLACCIDIILDVLEKYISKLEQLCDVKYTENKKTHRYINGDWRGFKEQYNNVMDGVNRYNDHYWIEIETQ
jgi:hypothetical protein